MKLKLLSAVVLGLTVASAGINAAESNETKAVAKVLNQENQVLAENSEGSRRLLAQGAEIFDNEYLIVLENASVELQYASSQCKVSHGANTLVAVTEEAQCGSGQQIAVGQATVTGVVTNAAGKPVPGKFGTNTTKSATGKYAGATVGSMIPLGFTGFMFLVTATNDGSSSP